MSTLPNRQQLPGARAKLDALRVEASALLTRDASDLTDADRARMDVLTTEIDDLGSRIERAVVILDAVDRGYTEGGSVGMRDGHGMNRDVNFNVRNDPFDDLDNLGRASSDELRGRAEHIAEHHRPATFTVNDGQREAVAKLACRESTRSFDADAVREHLVLSASPEYEKAFHDYLRTRSAQRPAILDGHTRAAMSLTAANGGVLVPQWLDPTINLTNSGSNNEVRRVSGHASITTNVWEGVTSAGVNAEWLGEGSEAADATPTFVGPTITVHKAAAYAFASYEVLMDSGFDEFGTLVADAKDRIEETAFTTGTGSSQPYGLITRLSGVGPRVNGTSYVTGITSTADFVVGDIYNMFEQLAPRWRRDATWMANVTIIDLIRKFGVSDSHSLLTHLGDGTPERLLGRPVVQNEAMDSTVVSGSDDDVLLFGDFKAGYKVVDRIGLEIVYDPMVLGSNRRPSGQAAWFAYWRCGADILSSNSAKLLRL